MPADDLRASDAEREDVVADLRTHATEGRLTVEELEERLDRVHAARTRADLAAQLADLPRPARPARPRPDARAELREHVRTYLFVMALLVAIWALTGMGYFWPVWPALGWGIALLPHAGHRPRTHRAGG